ncbi:NUDIX hydrolase [Lolliginicoccus levis]|uniref:NUDIX hydrolase n=1 Tax=Lolliginicoccus levis TaxID=2919542 RepID=UPI00241DB03C|nr:NUDIX hydrolase [Lolliginicoccus levis]
MKPLPSQDRSENHDGAQPGQGRGSSKDQSRSARGAARGGRRNRYPAKNSNQGNEKPARKRRLRTVRETSAGGLVITGWEGGREMLRAALIGRLDRRGRLLWSLPKGHIELGETAEETAMREVAEETGIQGRVLASLGSIDYWFVTEGRRVHKTVHHYLLRFLGGELSDADMEVTEVAWVPLSELDSRLAYADERKLARMASELIASMKDLVDAGIEAVTEDKPAEPPPSSNPSSNPGTTRDSTTS